MALVRWVTEMGMGVDVHGGDYTKAARRAVSDAIRHSSLNFFDAAGKTVHDMQIEAIIAVQDPDALDIDAIAAELPYGTVTVSPRSGGVDVAGPVRADGSHDLMVVANAVILVSFPEE